VGLLDALRACLRRRKREPVARRMPDRGPKPRIGAYVVHAQKGLRFAVPAGMSDSLWLWLMNQGWRVDPHRPDRREYRDIPASYVARLTDADPAQRKGLMVDAIVSAQPRTALVRNKPRADP
jgi:hypothetical protein